MASFSDLITHTRASTATYVDANGILQTAASGVPRVGHHIYDGSQWVNEGILHESEARTNVFLDSGDVFGSNWTGNASGDWGTYDDSVTSYFGGIAYRLEGNGLTSSLNRGQIYGVFSGSDETVSVWVEDGTGGFQVGFYDTTTGSFVYRAELTWTSGSLSTISGTGSVKSEYFGTGPNGGDFYRVSMTASGTSGNGRRVYIYPGGTGTTTDGCIIHGAQAEEAPTPSSYIPTAGSQVTRAADSMTIPAAKLPYDATNMSIAMEGRMTYADTDASLNEPGFFDWVLDSNNRIRVYQYTAAAKTGKVAFVQEESGTQFAVQTADDYNSPGINVPFSIASRHGSTFINGAVDGAALTENTTPTALPDLSATDLDLGLDFMGTIRLFRMWNEDLDDTGIAEASA